MPFTSESAREAGKKSSRKGVPNKKTSEIRDNIQWIIEEITPKILSDLQHLDADKRVHHYVRILAFILPKLNQEDIRQTYLTSKVEVDGEEIDLSNPESVDQWIKNN